MQYIKQIPNKIKRPFGQLVLGVSVIVMGALLVNLLGIENMFNEDMPKDSTLILDESPSESTPLDNEESEKFSAISISGVASNIEIRGITFSGFYGGIETESGGTVTDLRIIDTAYENVERPIILDGIVNDVKIINAQIKNDN